MKKYACPRVRVLELNNEVLLAGSIDESETKIDIGNVDTDKRTNPWNSAASNSQSAIWDNN